MAATAMEPTERARFAPPARMARAAAWGAVVALVAVGTGLPAVASAQLKCQSRELLAADATAVRSAANAALAGHGSLAPASARYCRNPGFAYAWFDSAAERRTDGENRWYSLQCQRRRAAWTCQEPVLEQELELTTGVLGAPRRLVLRLDANVDAAQARSLAARATEVLFGNAQAPPPACHPGRDAQSAWTDARRRSGPDGADNPLTLEVSAAGRDIRFGFLLGIVFRPAGPGPDDWAACWDELIFVTAGHRP